MNRRIASILSLIFFLAILAFASSTSMDSFTDTNGTLLTSHTSEDGTTWTKDGGADTAEIQSNRVTTTGGAGQSVELYTSAIPDSADYSVFVDFYVIDAGGCLSGVWGRKAIGASSGYMFRYQQGAALWQLYRWNGGSTTPLGSDYSQTLTVGNTYTAELRMIGSQISGYVNGVLRVGPVTDSGWTAAGRAGLHVQSSGPTTGIHLDNYSTAPSRGTSSRLHFHK